MSGIKYENLGQYLKHERLKRNLTQKQFASFLEMTETHYVLLETNKYGCGVMTLQRIGEKLKVSSKTLRRLDDATRQMVAERKLNEKH